MNKTNQQEKNEMKNLSSSEFFRIRNIVIRSQRRVKDRDEIKRISDAWLKIERAWYQAQPDPDFKSQGVDQ